MNCGIKPVHQLAVCRCRPDTTDDEDDGHGNRADEHRHTQATSVASERNPEKGEQCEAFCQPWNKEEFSNAVNMCRLKSHICRFADFGEEGVVDDMDGPYESNHEPRGDHMSHDDDAHM